MLWVDSPGPFITPTLVVAMDGWVNAGSAGTLAASMIADEGEVVGRFDPDRLYDYRMLRPTIFFEDGALNAVEWPEMTIRRVTVEGRDLLVMSGPEPNWGWREMAEALVDACRAWGVVEFVGIGGVPWAVPHTRPVTLMTTSTSVERLQRWSDGPQGAMQVPGAAVSVLEYKMHQAGIPTIGFWARVPNYVGSAFPAAAEALLARLAEHLGVQLDPGELAQQALDHLGQLDGLIGERPDVAAMVRQLEEVYDSASSISGDALAAEIERFLREQR